MTTTTTTTATRTSNVQAAIDHAKARGIFGTNTDPFYDLEDLTERPEDEGYDAWEDTHDGADRA